MSNLIQNSELTNYDQWQQERFGNIIPPIQVTPEGDLFESGIEEINRMAEYMNMNAELQLTEPLNY